MCKNEFKDNNHFGSRNSTIEIWALEIPESRMSSKRHSDTLCVNISFKIGVLSALGTLRGSPRTKIVIGYKFI